MVFRYVYLIPGITAIWFTCFFIATYTIAVLNDDVFPVFPYISDTGTWSPESCIFSLCLNVGAILVGIFGYTRFRQVRDILLNNPPSKQNLKKTNKISLYIGLLASFGVGLVGDFQETNVLAVHVLAAGMAFGLGTVFFSIQTYLSFKIYPGFGNKNTNILRLFCCVICTLCFFTAGVCAVLALTEFKGDDVTKWGSDDGGFITHLISVGAEWILFLFFIIFIVTFTGEFKQVVISEPQMQTVAPK